MFNEAQDQIYVLQIRSGRTEVYGKLYDKYLDEIYRYVFFKVRHDSNAEDLTSETFIKVLDYIVTSEKNVDNIRALFYRTARNLVIDFFRNKHQTETHIDIDDEDTFVASDNDVEILIDIKIDIEKLDNLMSKIKDEYREVLIMKFVNDMSIGDMARALDKTTGAVRVLVSRAQQALRRALKDHPIN